MTGVTAAATASSSPGRATSTIAAMSGTERAVTKECASTGWPPRSRSTLLTSAPTREPEPAARMTMAALGMAVRVVGSSFPRRYTAKRTPNTPALTSGRRRTSARLGDEVSQVGNAAESEWHLVCPLEALEPERGVTALIHGQG